MKINEGSNFLESYGLITYIISFYIIYSLIFLIFVSFC